MVAMREHEMNLADQPVLLTGASGTIGRLLARRLTALGWTLRLTDLLPFPDEVPPGVTFRQADLQDREAVAALAEGCGLILHFGGVSVEHPFETIAGPNLAGCFHVWEAARMAGARIVFASSNHVFGFYPRDVRLDEADPMRPDGFYGLSKAYGELLGRLYWDKHGVESVLVRIGSVLPEPVEARMLSTWFSPDDLVSLLQCCATAPAIGCATIWGASANTRSFWGRDDRDRIGWAPRDSADRWEERLSPLVTDDPVAEHHQGGRFASIDYSRTDKPPAVTASRKR